MTSSNQTSANRQGKRVFWLAIILLVSVIYITIFRVQTFPFEAMMIGFITIGWFAFDAVLLGVSYLKEEKSEKED